MGEVTGPHFDNLLKKLSIFIRPPILSPTLSDTPGPAPCRKGDSQNMTSSGNASSFQPQVRKSLLQLIFSGAYLLRWNDKLRPRDLLEIDKQGHKMIVATLLWDKMSRELSAEKRATLGRELIEGALFDYFYRLVVTDIKPPIFYQIKNNREQYKKLTEHVFRELQPTLVPLGSFWERFKTWHTKPETHLTARRILDAAHMFASQWEFRLIEPMNSFDQEMPAIAATFTKELNALRDSVQGVDALLDEKSALHGFASFCGQLRFQVRWTKAPRIPPTDVLGHMFTVAAFAYFFSMSVGACQVRCCNNFFSGLFHDLPELLTRDIISPVKKSSDALASLIKDFENTELERRIFGPLREGHEECLVETLQYFLGMEVGSEFRECIRRDGHVTAINGFGELHEKHNTDSDDPKDGQLIKACDLLAAFLEANNSIRSGISSPRLFAACERLRDEMTDRKRFPAELHIDSLLADFD